MESKIKIRCLLRDQHNHVRPIEAFMGSGASFVYDDEWLPQNITSENTDIVLCINDYHHEIACCLDAAHRQGIPSLTLQDGTLDWRCQYENPLFAVGGGAPQHQPVLADKIACIGGQSYRHIAAWGNRHKVELTGMPKLDQLLNRPVVNKEHSERKCILVMTAKKPWFDDSQRATVLRSLLELKEYLDVQPHIEAVWRVTKDIHALLGVENQLQETETTELITVLDRVDAVISTPSTAIIESMLRDRPVAILDYHNTPKFIQTAWTISSREHISTVVDELIAPPATKMLYQKTALNDALHIDGPAAPRVAELIVKMAEAGRLGRSSGKFPRLPINMLETRVLPTCSEPPELSLLYPDNQIFSDKDVTSLQLQLARLKKSHEMALLALKSRGVGYWADVVFRRMVRLIKQRR